MNQTYRWSIDLIRCGMGKKAPPTQVDVKSTFLFNHLLTSFLFS